MISFGGKGFSIEPVLHDLDVNYYKIGRLKNKTKWAILTKWVVYNKIGPNPQLNVFINELNCLLSFKPIKPLPNNYSALIYKKICMLFLMRVQWCVVYITKLTNKVREQK